MVGWYCTISGLLCQVELDKNQSDELRAVADLDFSNFCNVSLNLGGGNEPTLER